MSSDTLRNIQKIYKVGNYLKLHIPKRIADILGFKAGDYIEVNYGEIIHRGDKKEGLPKL